MTRQNIINNLIKTYGYKSYLEIGLNNPEYNYVHIQCEHKESVDPYNGGNYYDNNNLP